MKRLQFIFSHSIFISFCAAALCWQSFLLLHIPVNYRVCWLIFFSTLSSYNFYWVLSKFHFSNRAEIIGFLRRHFSNLLFFFLASFGLIYCLYFLQHLFPTILIAVFLTIVYSVPLWPFKQLAFTRKAGFLKTLLLAFTWAYVTVILPVQKGSFIYDRPTLLLFSARFLFMLMLCIIFDSRDISVDKINSLRSLATDVSRKTLSRMMSVIFTVYILFGLMLRYYYDDRAQLAAFFITGLATWVVYRYSLKKQGYFFYYFIVDGLMLFSSAATFVASI